MTYSKDDTTSSYYEQEILHNLVELKYSLDCAHRSLQEALADLRRASRHNDEINALTLKREMECCHAI